MLSASCSLDEDALSTQLDRYRAVGADAQVIEEGTGRLVLRLSDQTSAAVIGELIAVERRCCPFFELDWDPEAHRLTVAVSRDEHQPALAAIAGTLGIAR